MEIQGLEKSEKRTLDIQWVKEHLVCRLVNRKNNEELLKDVVRQINRCFSLQIKTDILMLNAA